MINNKKESRKGDFVFQVKQDMKEMDINMDDNEIKELSIRKWKKLVNEKTKEAALRYLVSENRQKEKTKHIKFKTLKLSEYLRTNKNTNISNIIFSLRSGGLDIKTWNKWKYDDNLCVMCENKEENMDHLMECLEYGETKDFVWREVFETKIETQVMIAKEVSRRMEIREKKLKAGLDDPPGSHAPTDVVEFNGEIYR